MKILNTLAIVAALAATSPLAARAQDKFDDGIDRAKATAFDKRMFAGPVGEKASACFERRYDAAHLKQHPKQKVSTMKILVTAENPPGEPTAYTYRLGVQLRNRPENFDGNSSCSHFVVEDADNEIRFSCAVECGGGGLEIALSKDDKSAIVRLEAIAIWDRKKPDSEGETLEGGADDKVFRVDRVDNRECAQLLPNREELAELKQRK